MLFWASTAGMSSLQHNQHPGTRTTVTARLAAYSVTQEQDIRTFCLKQFLSVVQLDCSHLLKLAASLTGSLYMSKLSP